MKELDFEGEFQTEHSKYPATFVGTLSTYGKEYIYIFSYLDMYVLTDIYGNTEFGFSIVNKPKERIGYVNVYKSASGNLYGVSCAHSLNQAKEWVRGGPTAPLVGRIKVKLEERFDE